MTGNIHSLRCMCVLHPIVEAAGVYSAVEVCTAAELCLGMSLCVCMQFNDPPLSILIVDLRDCVSLHGR